VSDRRLLHDHVQRDAGDRERRRVSLQHGRLGRVHGLEARRHGVHHGTYVGRKSS
jgi:hypothetical protein